MGAGVETGWAVQPERFAFCCGRSSLVGILLRALFQERWPQTPLTNQHDDSPFVRVEEAVSGRKLVFFGATPTRAELKEVAWDKDTSVLTLEATAAELDAALKSFEGGPTFVSPGLLQMLSTTAENSARLTSREQDVARLLLEGMSNREIAERLVISTHTVRTHLQAMSTRLQVGSRGRLAAKIRDLGLA